MKSIPLSLVLLAAALPIHAQNTRAPFSLQPDAPAPATNGPALDPKTKLPVDISVPQPGGENTTSVKSDNSDIDMEARKAMFRGNVRVTSPGYTLKSEEMDVYFSKTTNTIDRIEARGNVVIDQKDQSGQANSLVYTIADETMVLKGNARVKQKDNVVSGPTIILCRTNDSMRVEGGSTLFLPSGGPSKN
jgi:lipopolysaccharide export system protein LptA